MKQKIPKKNLRNTRQILEKQLTLEVSTGNSNERNSQSNSVRANYSEYSQFEAVCLNDGKNVHINKQFYTGMFSIKKIQNVQQIIYQKFLESLQIAQREVFEAIQKENLQKIKQLFLRYTLPVHMKKRKFNLNNNVLHESVKIGSKQLIDYFMNKSVELVNQGNDSRRTPIHFCLIYHPNLIFHFIQKWNKYIDWSYKDICGNTYSHYCFFYSADQSIKEIIKNKHLDGLNNLGMKSFECLPVSQNTFKFKYSKEQMIESVRKVQHFQKNPNYKYDDQKRFSKFSKFSKLIQKKWTSYLSQEQLLSEKTYQQITIHDFDIISKLGEGGYSKVFKVRYKPSKNLYALKVFQKSKLDRNTLKYFLNQRDVLIKCTHPYLIKFYCSFQSNRFLFLVLQLCQGGTLKNLIYNTNEIFKEDRIKIYISQMISVLSYLHEKDIIHRDLKPQNIAMDEEGHIKLLDLGLSKLLKKNFTKTICGTEQYLPPEVLNKQQYTYTIDWYMLGIVIYQMLTKTTPFRYVKRQNEKKKTIQPLFGISEQLQDFLNKLLQYNKDLRIGSQRDAQQLKQHVWFHDVNWNTVSKKKIMKDLNKKWNDEILIQDYMELEEWFQKSEMDFINENCSDIDWNRFLRTL